MFGSIHQLTTFYLGANSNTTLAAAAAVPALCTSTLNWSSLHVSMSLGVFLVTINTAIGLAIHYVRPKYLQGK